MIPMPQSVLKSFRAVAKRLFGRARNDSVWLSVTATPEKLVLRAAWNDSALECRVQSQFDPATFAVRLEQLAACEAKSSEPVSFEASADSVAIQWLDRGIPQQAFCPRPTEELPTFPMKPARVWTTDAGLLRALAAANEITNSESSRYALDCLTLRGEPGSIAATDGRHLLVQCGCEFPWTGDLLVPSSPVFRAPQLATDGPVTIGATDLHIALSNDSWTVWLPINKDGRFPKIDDIVQHESGALSRLELAPADAEFLLPRLDSLPGSESDDRRITLALDGQVTIRAVADEQAKPVELVLTNGHYEGEPVSVGFNRGNLARALKLGFSRFLIFKPDTAIQCQADDRTYIFMPLEPTEVPAGQEPLRIESPVATTRLRVHGTKTKERNVTQTTPTAVDKPAAATKSNKRPSPVATKTPVEQAIALRDSLLLVARQANDLARTLKLQRRQEQIVASTLASLKSLQKLAG